MRLSWLFSQGGLKNLRFAVVGEHVPADSLGVSGALGDDSDKAASFCFNFRVVGGIC